MPKGVVKCGNCVDDTRRLFGKTFSEIDTNKDDFMEEAEIETAAGTWPTEGTGYAGWTPEELTNSAMSLIDHQNPDKISQEEWENYKAAHAHPFITITADDESQAETTE